MQHGHYTITTFSCCAIPDWESADDAESDDTGSEEEDSQSESGEEQETDNEQNKKDNSVPMDDKTESSQSQGTSSQGQLLDYSSDSTNGESERCPICLARLNMQDVGSPEACDHSFCLDCLLEWSKVGFL